MSKKIISVRTKDNLITTALSNEIGVGGALLAKDSIINSSTPPTKIMLIGDSITQGTSHNIMGYRYPLSQKLNTEGYNVDLIGSKNKFAIDDDTPHPDTNWDMDHEAQSGYRTDMMDSRIKELYAQNPQSVNTDIALIHLGTNDILQSQSNASTITELGSLIQTLRAVNPNVKILLAQIIPETFANSNEVANYNHDLVAFANQINTANSPVILVDQFSGFNPATDTYDGIHPNNIGAEKVTERWMQALRQLNIPKIETPIEKFVHLESDLGLSAIFSTVGAFIGGFTAPFINYGFQKIISAFKGKKTNSPQIKLQKIQSLKNNTIVGAISTGIALGIQGGFYGAGLIGGPIGAIIGAASGLLIGSITGSIGFYFGSKLYNHVFFKDK